MVALCASINVDRSLIFKLANNGIVQCIMVQALEGDVSSMVTITTRKILALHNVVEM